MTTREEENLPSEEELTDLDDILSDDDPIVIILDDDEIPPEPAEETAAAPEKAPQLINLGSRARARVAEAPVYQEPAAEAPVADQAPADELSLDGPPEDFSDLITEVEQRSQQQQPQFQPEPEPEPEPVLEPESPRRQRKQGRQQRRRRRPQEDPEDWALGELEQELDEEIQNELFPWAARMGLPWLGGAIVLLAIALLGILLLIGRSYYELPIARRAFHHLHDMLRPSGTLGLTLGISGLGIMLFSLIYLVRKQFVSWARFGSLQGWLGIHIFTGFLGPAIILFHAAFVPYSAIGFLAFGAMLVVVFSGIVGRYVYVYCPKTLEGRELEFEDVRQRLVVYRKKLTDLGIDASLLRIDEPTTNKGRMPWLIGAIIGVIWGDRQSKQEFARLSNAISEREDLRVQMSRILILARRLSKERQWVVRYNELRKIMGAWRFFHRWLAIIMFLAILYHVGIAVVFGDLWIFGGKELMLLNPRAPLIIGTFLIFLLGGLLAMYSPMPGNIASAHSSIQGMLTIGGCNQCHKGSGIAEGCLECHTEIAAQLDGDKGYHDFLLKDNVECASCHAEHRGDESPLVTSASWGPQVFRVFRHPHVKFKLTGVHDGLLCESCHLHKIEEPFTLPNFAAFPRHRSFLGLDQNCNTCHQDVHTDGLTGDCSTCHGQEVFRPPTHFNHSKHFPLEGGHERLSCVECHVIPPPETPSKPRPFPFHKVRGTSCSECHDSPHRVFVGSCEKCHAQPEPLWSSATDYITPEIHELTGFRLKPPHSRVACYECHPRELPFKGRYHDPTSPSYLRQQDTCEGCHGDVHDGQFLDQEKECLDCHQRLRFVPSKFGHKAHAKVFPLTGAHEAVACNGCHRMDQERHTRQYVDTATECKACHQNPHGSQFAAKIERRDCAACHLTDGDTFRIHRFDHTERTGYALVGRHARAECTECHVEVLESFGGVFTRVRRYEGTPSSGSGCHKDIHRGQFQYYGQDSCSACHVSATSWKTVRFDHDNQSRFPLRGAHSGLACSRCHLPTTLEDGSEVVQYRPLGRECNDCHDLRSE